MKLNSAQKQRRDDLAASARQAENDKRWVDACSLWRQCLEEFEARPSWLAGYGKALAGLNLFEEALDVFDDLRRNEPGSPHGLAGMAQVSGSMRDFSRALGHWDALKAGFPTDWKPAWEGKRANALLKLGRVEEAEQAFDALATVQPDDPAGLLGLAVVADLRRDREAAIVLWDRIAKAFPDDQKVAAARIRHELKRGTVEKAAMRLADPSSLSAAERLLLDAELAFLGMRYADAIGALAAARKDGIEPARLWAKELAFRERAILEPADTASFVAAASEALAAFPENRELQEAQARALIVDGQTERAAEAIAAFGRELERSRDGLLLGAWAKHAAGDVDGSIALVGRALEHGFVASVHDQGPAPAPPNPALIGRARPDIALFTNVKNEAEYLPWFLSYYRSLGIERFYVTDDRSSDGSRDILAAEPDVTLFESRGDFFAAGGGMAWINHLLAENGGPWSVYVDTDEMLVFPGCETRPLRDWLAEVGKSGQEAVPGFMLDLYDEAVPETGPGPIADPLALTPFFDAEYFRFGSLDFPYFAIGGGPRCRLFGTYEHLRKVPVFRGDRGLRFLSSHATTPARLGPHGALLLHFKLLRQARAMEAGQDLSRVASRSQGAIARHGRYEEMLGHGGLRHDGTRRYAGSGDPNLNPLFDLVGPGRARSDLA